MSRIAYVNGAYVPLEDARVSVMDRGFLFADGVYEVTAVLDGKLVDFDPHVTRLERSLKELQMPMPMPAEALKTIHLELMAKNDLTEGGIYLQITRGAIDRDFAFPKVPIPQTVVMFTQAKAIRESAAAKTGMAVITLPDIRWKRRDIKSVALLAQVLAKQAAAAAGAGEAWMVEDGVVTEGGSSNAWIVTKDGRIVTRQVSNAILAGCTRKSVIRLAELSQLKIEERPFTVEEAKNAAEAFVTSASAFVTPVISVDGVPIGTGKPGPIATRLRQIYLDYAVSDA
jgi:D-alanine transaminase